MQITILFPVKYVILNVFCLLYLLCMPAEANAILGLLFRIQAANTFVLSI